VRCFGPTYQQGETNAAEKQPFCTMYRENITRLLELRYFSLFASLA